MNVFFLLVIILVLPQPLGAATLAELQDLAVSNRPLVKRAEALIEQSRQEQRLARSAYYPFVDLSYSTITRNQASLMEERENSILAGTAGWNLFSGFHTRYVAASADARMAVAALRRAALEQDLRLTVALRYLAIFNQRAQVRMSSDTLSTLERFYEEGEQRFRLGLLDQSELLKFQVDRDNARLTLRRTEAELRKALQLLNREVGQHINPDELVFTEFDGLPILDDYENYQRLLPARRSELKALQGVIEAAGYQLQAEQSSWFPHLDLAGSYRRIDDSYFNGSGNRRDDELRAELVLRFNLFRGFADEAQVARAEVEIRAVTYDYQELLADLQLELANLMIDYDISLANVAVAKEDIRSAEEHLRITEMKYREGLQRQLDLLEAVANLTRARTSYDSMLYTVFATYYRINRMIEAPPR